MTAGTKLQVYDLYMTVQGVMMYGDSAATVENRCDMW